MSKRFPFDWRHPIGYFVAVILQFIPIAYHYTFVACEATFEGGLFAFTLSFTEDIRNDVKSLNENAKSQTNRFQTLKQISDFVQYHSTFKRLSKIIQLQAVKLTFVSKKIAFRVHMILDMSRSF